MDIELQHSGEQKTLDMGGGANKSTPGFTLEKPGPNYRPLANRSAPMAPPPARPPPPVLNAERPPKVSEVNQALEDFANPQHIRTQEEDGDDSEDGFSEGDSDDDDDMDDSKTLSEYAPEHVEDYLRPSPGYNTLDEESSALLFKLHRAKKAGMPLPSLTINSDIRELRSTVARVEEEISLDSSIKFQRKMVCLLTSSLEWMSNKYSPFGEDLEGWSENVASGISDYDTIFTELFYKYRSSLKVGPEVRLIFALAGSMFWFNLTKTMSKRVAASAANPGAPGGLDLGSMLGAMMGGGVGKPPPPRQAPAAGAGGPPQTAPAPATNTNAGVSRPPGEFTRRPMKGPGTTIGNLFGQDGPPQPAAPPIMSEESLFPGGAPPVFEPMGPPTMSAKVGGRKRSRDDSESDRLSDIVSDSGSDTSSDSGGSSSASETDSDTTKGGSIRVSTVPVGRGRGRGRGRGGGRGGATKNVLNL